MKSADGTEPIIRTGVIPAPGELKALHNWSDQGEVKWESAKSGSRSLSKHLDVPSWHDREGESPVRRLPMM